ncbi:hypothetical protein ACB092_10G117800 [Castanea dentata]
MASNVSEARRRKIMERGSDRLALITGRIQSLPPSSSHEEITTDSDNPSSQPLISHPAAVSPHGEDEHDPVTNASQTEADIGESNLAPPLRKCEISVEALGACASEFSGKAQSPLVSSIDQNSSASTLDSEQHLEQQRPQHRFFTPNQISSAIASSERTRILCSVTVALLVVLSYLGFPLLGSYIIKSMLSFRPLYLLLLTNVTIVLARLLADKQTGFERAAGDENETPSLNGYGWAEQVGNTLETGLVMQKALDAIFMDCSVYAIIVICGLSLASLFS